MNGIGQDSHTIDIDAPYDLENGKSEIQEESGAQILPAGVVMMVIVHETKLNDVLQRTIEGAASPTAEGAR